MTTHRNGGGGLFGAGPGVIGFEIGVGLLDKLWIAV